MDKKVIMSKLVLELQQAAQNSEVKVSDLLRKALVVSKKLSIDDMTDWINLELSGYEKQANKLPSYRTVRGFVMIHHPHERLKPIQSSNIPQITLSNASQSQVGTSIAKIEESKKNASNPTVMLLDQKKKKQIWKYLVHHFELVLQVDSAQIHGILDEVRNIILRWSLELEKRGILGEGMSFSNEEKAAATQINNQVINNIGNMQNSAVQQGSSGGIHQQSNISINQLKELSQFITELKSALLNLELDQESKAELESDISTVEHQQTLSRPKHPIIVGSLQSIKSILEKTASSALVSALLQQIDYIINGLFS